MFLNFHVPSIDEDEINEVIDCLRSGWITTGPKVKKFENEFASYIGCKHAIAVNSGTAALHLALDAIGLKRNDKVLIPTFTFAATAEVITYFGAKPVFIDIDNETFNLDPLKIEEYVEQNRQNTDDIKAIIPVHFAGQPCKMDNILSIANKYDLKIIEDAAHAVPCSYKDNMIGTIGDMTAFSFYATKCITTGEGGMITTDSDELAERISVMRLHGISKDAWKRYSAEGSWYYEIIYPGYKYNLTDIAAAIGIHQLRKSNFFYNKRKKIADKYNAAFSKLKPYLRIPVISNKNSNYPHAWHLYVLLLNKNKLTISRDEFITEMKRQKIGASVHFIPLHMHPLYKKKYHYRLGDFPVAENIYQQCVSLPIYPKMEDKDINAVIDVVTRIVHKHKKC
jgi:dTDP-4-amino-4,6-dideoxygalactose transaminase